MIFTGALDRYPRLDLLLAHGGGVLPFVAGRLDATWTAYRPERWHGPDILTLEPSSYLRRFHVDTNTWSVPALRLLVEVMGPERLVVGNDQPPVWASLEDSLALPGRPGAAPSPSARPCSGGTRCGSSGCARSSTSDG